MRKSSVKLPLLFNVRRNNIPIERHFLPKGVRSGITFNKSYAEVDACIAAGLDYHKWRKNKYPPWLKAEVVVWHRNSRLIEAHSKSAESKEVDRLSKKKGKK